MNLEYFRKEYFTQVKGLKLGTDNETADRHVNLAYLEVFRAHKWVYRKRDGQIILIPNYTTGTCTVTKFDGTNSSNAKTVTFSGATLTNSMLGRYLNVGDSNHWHKIIYISGNTAYLETEIIDVDGGGNSFKIWKRFYYVKSEADIILDFDKWAQSSLVYRNYSQLQDEVNNISSEGTTTDFSEYGIDPYDDVEYSTGTIEGSTDSNILTGTNTSWLSSGIESLDIIQINSVDYYIKRVESDTRIILYNYIENSITLGTSYVVRKNNPIGFQFYAQTDEYRALNYSYLAKAAPLIHPTKDHIKLPDEFAPAILSRSIAYGFMGVEKNEYLNKLSIYSDELGKLKEKVRVVSPRYMQFSVKIPNFMPGRS